MPRGELGGDHRRLHRDDQAVAPEQRGEPRQARGRHDIHAAFRVARFVDFETQGDDVVHRLMEQAVVLLVRGGDLGRAGAPGLQAAAEPRVLILRDAGGRRGQNRRPVLEIVVQAAVPRAARRHRDVEADAAVGVHRVAVRVARYRQRAREVGVDIGGAQRLLRLVPGGGDPPPAHEVAGLDLEHVGEVAPRRYLEVEAHRLEAKIGEVEILVDAALDPAADDQPERVLRNDAVLRHDRRVGEVDALREVADRRPVQQRPALPVGVDVPPAQQPRVVEHQPLRAGHRQRAVRLGGEHGVPVMDDELRRADGDFEGHVTRGLRWMGRQGLVARREVWRTGRIITEVPAIR